MCNQRQRSEISYSSSGRCCCPIACTKNSTLFPVEFLFTLVPSDGLACVTTMCFTYKRTNFKLILTLWTSSFYKETRYVYFLFYRNVADLLQYQEDEKNGIRSRVLVISDRWVEHCYSLVLIIHVIACIRSAPACIDQEAAQTSQKRRNKLRK